MRRMSLAPYSSSREPENGVHSSNGGGLHAGCAPLQQQQHGTYVLTGVLVHQGNSLHSGT